MKFDWDNIRIFVAAARCGSLRQTAENLQVGHATVRRNLEKLESQLATRLFERSGSGMTLTHAGEVLLQHAEKMELNSLEIEKQIFGLDDEAVGEVKISLPPSFAGAYFAPILAGFSNKFPDISVDILATNQFSDLLRYEADISIRAAKKVEDDVVGRKLTDYVATAFASKEYLEKIGPLQSGDGSNAQWIGWGDDGHWIKETPFPNAKQQHALFEVFMQIEACAAGVGLIWIPAFLGDMDKRIMRVPDTKPLPDRSLWLLLHGELKKTARVRALVDYIADYVSRDRLRYIV